MRAKLVAAAGVAVSAALVLYIAYKFDLRAAAGALALADMWWFVPAAGLYVLLFPLRGIRWSILLRDVKKVPVGSATEVFLVGFMANNLLPARLGDVARAFVLAKREGVSATSSFANVMLERVFDGLTVVGMLAAVLLIDPPAATWVRGVGGLFAALFVGVVVASALLAWNEAFALRLAARLLSPLPKKLSEKLLDLAAKLAKGLHTLKSPKATLQVIGLSILIWSAEVGVYFIAQRAFGLSIPPLGLVLTMAVLTLGLTAPSAPGFVGVYEYTLIKTVGLYGVGEPLAPAFAIAMHLIHYVPGTLLGLGCTWLAGYKLRELRSAGDELAEGEPA